ncbi:CPBP family intramembrane glutamic endopeptidase [Flavicella sp.]|uniref:CPBP family intramembrane glutamic endopeptidase n=1 Tax=Flavicella sp. TaxID=2957742 RepID=UPI00261B0C9B|nr:CPBP family intramembrane glutamic endopeptidase [Flavicella sp.]MDG1805611.1 CPBP family intramembrane metalloprotease [Flavicella sp.]MDG2281057.1 CPBP family intramembrane metalloprotease [Flavicella sp.]
MNKTLLAAEYVLLFIILPISFCFDYPIYLKIGLGAFFFIIQITYLIKNKYPFPKKPFQSYHKRIGIQIGLNLLGLILITIVYLKISDPDSLFNVVRINPKMWITFIAIYTFLSVIPQEIIYRSFYFSRYKKLFPNSNALILSNALVFSLGHIFFNNILVSGITFIGGVVFAYTYTKTKSLWIVSIEHAIYGCWLYTVGFGAALGFPIP